MKKASKIVRNASEDPSARVRLRLLEGEEEPVRGRIIIVKDNDGNWLLQGHR